MAASNGCVNAFIVVTEYYEMEITCDLEKRHIVLFAIATVEGGDRCE